jgi:branched-chain amino acid transport system ATP-binding protein
MSLLRVENLCVQRGLLKVLDSVSFEIEKGERLALVGPNGAGKSSLIEALIGVLPVQSGSIEAPEMGWVPEGRRIFPDLTVRENLLIGAHSIRDRSKVKRQLEEVQTLFPILSERSSQFAGTLSGGQQQMLALGRAWMKDPELLIVDELSLGLAPLIVSEAFSAIDRWIASRSERAVLLVEQNAKLALRNSDRGMILESGRIVLSADSKALLANPEIAKSYFGI